MARPRYCVTTSTQAYDRSSTPAANRSGGTKQHRVRDHVLEHAPIC